LKLVDQWSNFGGKGMLPFSEKRQKFLAMTTAHGSFDGCKVAVFAADLYDNEGISSWQITDSFVGVLSEGLLAGACTLPVKNHRCDRSTQ
jgi:hypothetical protein